MNEQRTEDRVTKLSEHIAKHIFDIGTEYSTRPNRMAYKIIWKGKEAEVGGLCEEAMARHVRDVISSFEATNG